jgi:AraC-like DNA-binding protein
MPRSKNLNNCLSIADLIPIASKLVKSIPLIRVNTFSPFINFLDHLGSPTQKWLEESKLRPFSLKDPEALIPRHLAFTFIEKAAHQEGIENLGFLAGQQISIPNLGNFGRLICGSLTLYDALKTIQVISPIHHSGERLWFKQRGEQVWFCHQFFDSLHFHRQHPSQFSLTLMLDLISIVKPGWRPSHICLQGNPINNSTQNTFFAGRKIREVAEFTAVSFPRSLLSLSLKSPLNLSRKQAQKSDLLLRSSAPAHNLSDSLQQAIAPLLPIGYPDIHLAAEIAGMSIRTLQRSLEQEGTTYSRLIEQIRFDQAIGWLQDPTVKLRDISTELGYKNSTHFTRAFKRWTGLSPKEYRSQSQDELIPNSVRDRPKIPSDNDQNEGKHHCPQIGDRHE